MGNHIWFEYDVFWVAAVFVSAAADPLHNKVAVIVDRIEVFISFAKPRMANTRGGVDSDFAFCSA